MLLKTKISWIFSIPFFCLLNFSCAHRSKETKIKIGFSQCVGSDQWRINMLDGMKRELSFFPNVVFIYKDANNNTNTQIEQINELMEDGIDLLIVSPNEAKPLTTVIENIYNKGIPVIVIRSQNIVFLIHGLYWRR